MKRYTIYIICVIFLAMISCKEDFLDTVPGEQYDDATIWGNNDLVESFVFNIYQGIPYPYQWYTSAALVDEAVPIQNDGVVSRVLTCTMTPEEQAAFTANWAACMENWWWASVYTHIRACNLFFSKIGTATVKDEEFRQQLKGEVHFLRAYFYYLLMAQYGGVPLIDHVVNIGDNYNIPRSTFEETINFIIADLDEAIADGKLSGQTDKTRATEGATLALKSRVLLYAASDLYSNNGSWASGYAHPELIAYTGGNRAERYQKAKEAAETAMQLGRYSLYNVNSDPSENFREIFLQMSSDEQIFITQYDKVNDCYWATDWIAWVYGTFSYGGWGLDQVTGNLADAFENADGSSFNFENQKNDPYSSRDPRFNATILHNGSAWYANSWGTLTPVIIDINGTDKNKGNTTGYYIKKFISPADNDYYFGTRQPQPYIQIRYAEVLLNYAEACIGLGEEALARGALNQIRSRADMPEIPSGESGEALLERYRNERRVELAWENHRFFDVRRWMIAEQAYGDATGVTFDGSTYHAMVFEKHAWNNSHYFIPISYDEMQRNTALIQNPGYN
jgi:starch-binding outer membrane protein, SusD/RagB family